MPVIIQCYGFLQHSRGLGYMYVDNLSVFWWFACTRVEQTHRSSCVVSPTCLPGTVLIAFAQ